MESNEAPGDRSQTGERAGHFLGQCTPVDSPHLGSLKLVAGNGTSVGTVMILLCPFKHGVISGGQISCVKENNSTQWSGGIPECNPISHEYQGFKLAMLVSIVSIAIILVMSIIFITSCLMNRVKKEETRRRERKRKKETEQLWQQSNTEEQTQSFYSQNDRINNNNNNNSSSSRSNSSIQEQHPRSQQKNYHDPLIIHHSQPTPGQMTPPLSWV